MTGQGTRDSATAPFRRWLPTLAFADALAFAALFVSLVLFKRLGKSNDETTIYTSLLFTPWLARPIIDRYLPQAARPQMSLAGTEMAVGSLLAVLAAVLPSNASTLDITLLLWLVSLAGAVHSVAAERLFRNGCAGHRRAVFAVRLAGFLLAMALCQGVIVALAGSMEVMARAIRSSWSVVLYLLASVSFVFSMAHLLTLRESDSAPSSAAAPLANIDRRTAAEVALLLLPLVPEALVTQVGQLFLIDAPHNGGLGLSPSEYGLAQGTVGMVALAVGCAIGVAVMRRCEPNKMLLPMAIAVTLPVGAYLYLSLCLTGDLLAICLCVSFKLLSLGFGLSILYRELVTRMQNRSLSMALIAFPLVVVGLFSGTFQESMGYRTFFAVVLSLTPLSIAAVALVNAKKTKQP